MRIPSGVFEFPSKDIDFGHIVLTTTETELMVGASALDARKAIIVENDSSSFIYISDTLPFVLANALLLMSGESIIITLDPSTYKPFYARTEYVTTDVRIYELR